MMATKVAVIGAGAHGLMAIKNFKEDGFDVTGFETRPYVGGLWKDSNDSSISVHATTTFNSSKYRSAISDFPFSEDTDDFPTAAQMHTYLTSYADHFGLQSVIHLNTKVVGMERDGELWALTVEPRDGPVRIEYFDKVAISTGAFTSPKLLRFQEQEHFAGNVIHSIDFHGPEPYVGKNVLIIGVHASAQDVAVSLRGTTNKVYMSHRGGIVLMPKYMPNGAVYDTAAGMRLLLIQTFMEKWFPSLWSWLFNKAILTACGKAFKIKPEWKFLPAPSVTVAPPLIGDELYSMLNSGYATSVPEVQQICGPRSIRFVDKTEIHDIDTIIQCTGYDFAIPFISSASPYQPYPKLGEPPHLYRNIFPLDPDPSIRNSLAFLGQVGIPLPGFVKNELDAQAVSQIWRGKSSLPTLTEMTLWHRNNLAWRAHQMKTYGPSSTFYTAFIKVDEHLHWLDHTAGTGIFDHFDWAWFNRRSWKLWWQDRDLYNICMNGLLTPAIFRLFDCGRRKPWLDARRQVFLDNEAARRQKEEKSKAMQIEREAEGKMNGHVVAKEKSM